MKRRDFITLLGGTAVAWPLAARAQQAGRMRRLGVLYAGAETDPQLIPNRAALTKGLADLGWVEGGNIRIDNRFGAGDVGRMQAIAKELISVKPDLLLAASTPAVAALQRETRTIPIVFVGVSDPVGSGLVASLPRPGGNITGFINIEDSIAGKWIEILKDIAPNVTRAALLYNPDTATYFSYYLQPFEAAARSSAIEPMAGTVRSAEDIEGILADIGNRPNAFVVMPDAFTSTKRNYDVMISLAARYHLPAIYPYRYYVSAGGLISYGIANADLYRRSAAYIDRILKGEKAADLPVQLPTKFELAINLKTAKALGLTIPAILQATADEIIE
jgi:putative ABC transport system substrate-binding protein